LGYISWDQTNKITELASELYNHPQTVLRALGNVKSDVLELEDEIMHAVYQNDQPDVDAIIAVNDSLKKDIGNQIDIINSQYLGPKSDLNELRKEFLKWEQLNNAFLNCTAAAKKKQGANS